MELRSSPGRYVALVLLACGTQVATVGVAFGVPPLRVEDPTPYVWTGLILSIHLAILSLKYLTPADRRDRWWEPVLIWFLVAGASLVLAPAFTVSKGNPRNVCLSNVKQLATAMHIYAADYDEHLPRVTKWKDAVSPYIKNDAVFGPCPTSSAPYGYAINEAVAGGSLVTFKDPAKLILIFECISKRPSPYGGEIHFSRSHNKRGAVAFADTHAKMIENKAGDAVWTP